MLWFDGNISEAVALSKQRNAIFVVFVEGDNDGSTEMLAVLSDPTVTKRLSDESNFLAIKLKSGSENYTHFAQIYQFVPVPSLFFIGRNGTPLEVVCAGVLAPSLSQRIDRILQVHNKGKEPEAESVLQSTVQPSTSSQSIREQTVCLLQSEGGSQVQPASKATPDSVRPDTPSEPAAKIQKTDHQEASKPAQKYEIVCDGDVCMRRPIVTDEEEAGPSCSSTNETTAQPAAEETTASIEQRLDRAKELIEAKKREQAAKEKELEKQKELERRSQGQGVVELKKWQADQELKQMQEERKREKLENNLARQRILEQIAQDRAERRARDLPAHTAPPCSEGSEQQPTIVVLRAAAAVPASRPARRAASSSRPVSGSSSRAACCCRGACVPPCSAGSEQQPTTSRPVSVAAVAVGCCELSVSVLVAAAGAGAGAGSGAGRARVQFKLPDGASHTAHFDADDTVADLHRYITDHLNVSCIFYLPLVLNAFVPATIV
ncbi:hypothetical protein ACJJTC_017406 [Scirpophaga incertulas]